MLGMVESECVELLDLLGISRSSLRKHLSQVQEKFSLDGLEVELLFFLTLNQLAGDALFPMLESLEELSIQINRQKLSDENRILLGQSRLITEYLIIENSQSRLRVAPEIMSFLCDSAGNLERALGHYLRPLDLTRPYSFWNSEQIKKLKKVISVQGQFCLITSHDFFQDQLEVNALLLSENRNGYALDFAKIEQSNEEIQCVLKRVRNSSILSRSLIILEVEDSADFGKVKEAVEVLSEGYFVLFQRQPNEMLSDRLPPRFIELFCEPRPQGLWKKELDFRQITLDPSILVRLESLFPLSFSKLVRVLDEVLLTESSSVEKVANEPFKFEDFARACRKQSSRQLEQYAKRVIPKYQWDDLILPPLTKVRLSEVYQHVLNRSQVEEDWKFSKRHNRGHGVTIVFEGASGTGKTMAAEVLAGELGLDLYQVDLSNITSKYVGETQKNLSKIFQAAKEVSGILFFDEGEALFSKRSETQSSQDRYANLETNYLLQELESFDGIVIISTNLAHNIDAAFLRRITFQIGFSQPDEITRAEIWKSQFKDGLSVSEDVDFDFLGSLPVTGGVIKNIARQAASWASIHSRELTMKDILWGIRREFNKLGMNIDRDFFGDQYWRQVSPEWEAQFARRRQKELRPH